MHSFKDALGREWSVRVDVDSRDLVLAEAKIDLDDLVFDEGVRERLLRPSVLGKAIWALCQADAKSRGIDRQSFFAGIRGEAFQAAADCLFQELVDFFPRAAATEEEASPSAAATSDASSGNSPASAESSPAG